jgi:toxin ParE1/3/4
VTKLRIAPAARSDLRDIRQHSKEAFGARQTRAYLDGLKQTFDLLIDNPQIGVPRPLLDSDMRQFPYRSHRIFYRENDEGLLVVRVLHHARDATDAFEQQ